LRRILSGLLAPADSIRRATSSRSR
jgi:hypothetical protein